MEGGGIISIKAERVDGQALVTIRDSGIGIDPEIMPRLFEKFISKSYQGTRLGLYISKSIVEAHGGRIWAENNTDVNGATFTFSLPVKKNSRSPNLIRKSTFADYHLILFLCPIYALRSIIKSTTCD
ncbi:MAG TPA: ATP-binding protein [Nitrososphaeraceae archaeon]|nr:ATP-binding protein [Nitrososphaeraceae archaeon]